MPFRPVALPPDVPGTLWLSAMPGRMEPWARFVAEAKRAKLTQLVCLTPREELAELSPAYHAAVAQGSLAWRWLNLPPRQNSCRPNKTKNLGAAMKDRNGTIWTNIQRQSGSTVAAVTG
ncbi:MAG: hypothetical protein ACREXG_08495 [Polaromonas sp.]